MELMGLPPEPPSFAFGPLDETDVSASFDTDLAVAPEGPRLGPGPGHPEVMAWARAM